MNKGLCGCGREGRYMILVDGGEVFSCNKYKRCLSHSELEEALRESRIKELEYRSALQKIHLDLELLSAKGIAEITSKALAEH